MEPFSDWSRFVAELSPHLYRYFCASVTAALAEECVQETWIRLVQKVEGGQFDSAKGNLRMYAYGIARFVRLEAKKSNFAVKSIDSPADLQVNLEENLVKNQAVLALRAAVQQLSDIQQEIVLLHIDKELTLESIAEAVNLPLGTVKSHVHRAKLRLKELLEDHMEVKS